jgi:hypothetical protein
MSLLREIQDAAVDPSTSIAVVLRKCMILASRLGHEPFKTWVDEELNGYSPDAVLPAYRRLEGLTSIGTLAGPMGSALRDVPLPMAPVPENLRDKHMTAELREGVARLEDLVLREQGDRERGGVIASRWSPDLIAMLQSKYYKGYSLIDAYIEIPKSGFVGALDAVRNRVLKFALEIEQQNPDAGDVPPGAAPPVPIERTRQIFNTFIMGGAQNVAVGSPAAVQHAQQLQAGDLAALTRFLAAQGVQEAELRELESAIGADPAPRAGKPWGKRVSGWLGTMMSKAGTGTWKIATSAAGEVLTAALKAYYGLQ